MGKELDEKILKEKEQNEKLLEDASALKELKDKMTILSREFSQEQKRSENLEIEANKVFEAEEQLMVLNEELVMLKKKMEASEASLESERIRNFELIESARSAYFQASESLVQLETDLKARENEILD